MSRLANFTIYGIAACTLLWGSAVAQTVDYTYDDAGRLISASYNNGETLITYSYDPAGNMLSKVIDADTDGDGIGNNADLDDDGDGMPDAYELANGLDPLDPSDAGGDPDGDGLTSLEEYLAGTDPQNDDTDSDNSLDGSDNCPLIANSNQRDRNSDGLGDVCTPTSLALADISSNNGAEIGISILGSVRVQVRDGIDDALLSDVNFGSDPGSAIEVIDDINSNGAPEIAVLGTRPSGQVRVQVRDSLSGAIVNTIFYGSVYAAVDMAVVPDTDGNGAPELAVLGQSATGGLRVQVRDALDDAETGTSFYGDNADPVDLQVLPDLNTNGFPEVVVHARVTATGQTRAQIRDTDTGQMVRQVFFGSAYTPIHLAVVDDVSGDGLPDLAQLARRSDTGAVRVQIKASSGGPVISNAFLGATDVPVAMVGIGDVNGGGSPDTATLVQRPDGTGKVVLRDGLTGDFIGNIFFGAIDNPVSLTLLDDLDASGDPELAALGERDGVRRVQIRDSVSGANVNTIDYP